MKIYPYRTTYDKLADGTAQGQVTEAGDRIVSTHFLGGRDWVLICRSGDPTVTELTAEQLEDLVARAVRAGVESGTRRARAIRAGAR